MKRPMKTQKSVRRKTSNTIFSARPEFVIVCPRCGTAQSSEEDFCRSCGCGFIFLSETNRYTA